MTSSSAPIDASISRARRFDRAAIDESARDVATRRGRDFRDRKVFAEGELLVHHADARGERVARPREVRGSDRSR